MYLPDIGAWQVKPSRKKSHRPRDLWAWDFAISSKGERAALLANKRLTGRATHYFCDGVGTSRNGCMFGAGGGVVDAIDPESGWILGSIRIGGNGNDPVNFVMGELEMTVVCEGGVWHVKKIRERLAKDENR